MWRLQLHDPSWPDKALAPTWLTFLFPTTTPDLQQAPSMLRNCEIRSNMTRTRFNRTHDQLLLPLLGALQLLLVMGVCVQSAHAQLQVERAVIFQDDDGNLHINSSANQRVFINGNDASALASLPFVWRDILVFPTQHTCGGSFALDESQQRCRLSFAQPGCGSWYISSAGPFQELKGVISFVAKDTPDGFTGGERPHTLTMSTGDGTHVWAFAAGYCTCPSISCCPANGGQSPPASMESFWSCQNVPGGCKVGANMYTTLFDQRPFHRRFEHPQHNVNITLCRDETRTNEDLLFSQLEVYVR